MSNATFWDVLIIVGPAAITALVSYGVARINSDAAVKKDRLRRRMDALEDIASALSRIDTDFAEAVAVKLDEKAICATFDRFRREHRPVLDLAHARLTLLGEDTAAAAVSAASAEIALRFCEAAEGEWADKPCEKALMAVSHKMETALHAVAEAYRQI